MIGLIIGGKTVIQGFLPAFKQMNDLKDDAIALKQKSGDLEFQKLQNNIYFDNVSFTFPGRVDTLKNINIEIKKGSITAFLGESGSGKTTLVDLILGLYEPDNGNVILDKKMLEDYEK